MKRGYKIVSGGTDNHLFLVDLIDKNITGKDADAALGRAHITVNKNAVPNDPRPPFVTSGLRIGTPAATTRGFKEAEVIELADWIADILDANGSGRRSGEGSRKGIGDLPQVSCVREVSGDGGRVTGQETAPSSSRLSAVRRSPITSTCTARSAITRKRKSSTPGWPARDSRSAAAANA